MKFAERLKQLMHDANVSQDALAKAIGYSQRAVSKWLNGQAVPTADAVYKCATYFDVSSDYLLGLED